MENSIVRVPVLINIASALYTSNRPVDVLKAIPNNIQFDGSLANSDLLGVESYIENSGTTPPSIEALSFKALQGSVDMAVTSPNSLSGVVKDARNTAYLNKSQVMFVSPLRIGTGITVTGCVINQLLTGTTTNILYLVFILRKNG